MIIFNGKTGNIRKYKMFQADLKCWLQLRKFTKPSQALHRFL